MADWSNTNTLDGIDHEPIKVKYHHGSPHPLNPRHIIYKIFKYVDIFFLTGAVNIFRCPLSCLLTTSQKED